VRFRWDPRKAASNLRKHGISFEEAATMLAHPPALVVDDIVHAERALIVGESLARRILVTVFVEPDDEVRIISARRATTHERRRYEEG
jgi:uncharacterized DUF497 family protein